MNDPSSDLSRMPKPGKGTGLSLWLTVTMAATIGLVFWVTRDNEIPKGPAPSFAELTEAFTRIEPPASSTLREGPDKSIKTGSEMMTARYELTESDDAARTHYRDNLSQNGWRYRRTLGSVPNWVDVYCKGPFQGSVELVRSRSPTSIIALSISWNEISVHECQ
jgi:hypothetical protein